MKIGFDLILCFIDVYISCNDFKVMPKANNIVWLNGRRNLINVYLFGIYTN